VLKGRWIAGCALAVAAATGLWELTRPDPPPGAGGLPVPPAASPASQASNPASTGAAPLNASTPEPPPQGQSAPDDPNARPGEPETLASGQSEAAAPSSGASGPQAQKPSPPRERNAFNDQALEDLGMDPSEIDRIFDAWANPIPGQPNENLDDTALAQRFRQLSAAEQGEVRARLGEEGYDALLYAVGEENRLLVTEVPPGTPGALAGVMPGDELLTVDGQRIFNRFELNWLEADLRDAGNVPVTVLRGGEVLHLSVDRGRMQVGLERIYLPPYRP